MYRIDPASYGFKVTTSGIISIDEVEQLKHELLQTLSGHNRPFSLLLDSRNIVPPPPEVLNEFLNLHAKIWLLSCERIAFVINSPVAKAQTIQMGHSSAPGKNDRTIDASKYPDWEERAIGWTESAIEPDATFVVSRETS